jgi:serine/threonine-protein kinase
VFDQLVIQRRLATIEQVEECLRLQREYQARGILRELGPIMQERGYLTGAQVRAVMTELGRARDSGESDETLRQRRPPASNDQKTRTEMAAFPLRFDDQKTRTELQAYAPEEDTTDLPRDGDVTLPPAKMPALGADGLIPRPPPGRYVPPPTPPPRPITGQRPIAPPPPGFAPAPPPGFAAPPPPAGFAPARAPASPPRPPPQPPPAARPSTSPSRPAADADLLGDGSVRSSLDIPGFSIEQKLGEGQMGAVYRGTHMASGTSVAIKILPPHLATNREYIARFKREAESAIQLQHPSIVRGLAVGELQGFHYFVMEYVDGESLEKRLQREKKVPERDALAWAIALASALECAAAEKIVHRDIKPANILLSRAGEVKLVDLGLAKQVGAGEEKKPQLTRVGMIMGSPYYLAPEQAACQPLDSRTDLYGLGATLYHLVTGGVAFDGADPIDILDQVISAPAPDPRLRAPHLSEPFARVIKLLMAKKRDDRYATPTELRLALEHLRKNGRLPGDTVPLGTRIREFFARLFGRG